MLVFDWLIQRSASAFESSGSNRTGHRSGEKKCRASSVKLGACALLILFKHAYVIILCKLAYVVCTQRRQEAFTQPEQPPAVTSQSSEPIEIHLEFLSNWGHASRIGFTEVQVFDQRGRRIAFADDDVMQRNMEDVRGDIMSLFNGKFKVSCLLLPLHPVSSDSNASLVDFRRRKRRTC